MYKGTFKKYYKTRYLNKKEILGYNKTFYNKIKE